MWLGIPIMVVCLTVLVLQSLSYISQGNLAGGTNIYGYPTGTVIVLLVVALFVIVGLVGAYQYLTGRNRTGHRTSGKRSVDDVFWKRPW